MKLKAIHKGVLSTLSFILVIVLLSACGNSGNANNGNTPQPGDSAGPEGGSGDKEEVVTLDLFVDHPWWPLKNWSGKVADEITRRTGVKLNITVASDDKQLPLMIASGSLPDLVATHSQRNRLADPALSYAWDDLIAEYAPDFEIDPERIAVNKASDGKFYTIRNFFSTQQEWEENRDYALLINGGISVRKEIMEELGNPEIKTLDDFTNLLQSVKDNYPDMVPLVLNPPNWHRVYFEHQFGAKKGFNDVDGSLVHSLNLPAYKEMYLFMNELYRKGFITAENYAYKSEDQGKQLMYSGKGFAYSWTTQGSDLLTAGAKDQGYTFVNLPVKISDSFSIVDSSVGWQGVFISKSNKNPEASIKLMQFLQSDEGQHLAFWGIEGEDWNWAEDGKYPKFNYNSTDDAVRIEMGANYWGLLIGSRTTELLGSYLPGTDATETSRDLTALTTFNPAIGLVEPEADSEEQIINTNIDEMIKNEETKVLLAGSEEEASRAYDSMVEQANRIGLERLQTWANEKYAEAKAQFE